QVIRQGEGNRTDGPVAALGPLRDVVACVSVAREFPLRIIGLGRRRIKLVKPLEQRRFAGLIPTYKGSDFLQGNPSAIVNIAVVLNAKPRRPKHRAPFSGGFPPV